MRNFIYCLLLISLFVQWDTLIYVSGNETDKKLGNQLFNHPKKLVKRINKDGDTKINQHLKFSSHEEFPENDGFPSRNSFKNNFETNLSPEAENSDENYLNERANLGRNKNNVERKSRQFKVKQFGGNLKRENTLERRKRQQKEDEVDTKETKDKQQTKGTRENTISNAEEGHDLSFNNVTYVGAVLEYEPYSEWNDEEKGYGVIRENANRIVSYAVKAKNQSADILITPEYGIESLDVYKNNTENFLTYTQYVPDPSDGIIPCHFSDDFDHFEAMEILSCGAKNNEIYLVVDLAELYPCSEETISVGPWQFYPSENCPEKGFFAYNTQVVFDRTGAVIARYRKQSLYKEPEFTPGPLDDTTAIFVTDFNVAFSLQICYDILHEHPGYSNVKNYGIRDVAMSTAWVDELPFYLADAMQNGWSLGLGINLLVSGNHYPEHHCLGSGIYRSYSNDVPVYTYDKDSGNVLLVAPVTTIAASNLMLNTNSKHVQTRSFSVQERHQLDSAPSMLNLNINEENRTHAIFHQNLTEFTKVHLKRGKPDETFYVIACSNDEFCCHLRYEYSGNLTYFFLVFSGTYLADHGEQNLGVQQCGVVWCKTFDYRTCARVELGLPEADSFGPFKISSSSFSSDLVYPVENQRNLSLISNSNLDFEVNGNYFSISANKPIENHLTAALCGRWFDIDEI